MVRCTVATTTAVLDRCEVELGFAAELIVLVFWQVCYILFFVGPDSRNQKWPRMGGITNEIKV